MTKMTMFYPQAAPIAATTIWVSSPGWCSTWRGSFGDVRVVDVEHVGFGTAYEEESPSAQPLAMLRPMPSSRRSSDQNRKSDRLARRCPPILRGSFACFPEARALVLPRYPC